MTLKTGLEDKKKVAIAVVLGVVVLFLVLRMVFQMVGAGSAPAPRQLPTTITQSRPVAPPPQATQAGNQTSGEHEAVKV